MHADINIAFYSITGPDKFDAPVIGAKSAEVKLKRNYYVIVGDLFEQVTEKMEVFPENEEINASRHEIKAYATTKIYLKNYQIGAHLTRTSQNIYHSLNINLDHYDKDGNVDYTIQGLKVEQGEDPRLTAYYSSTPIKHDDSGTPVLSGTTAAYKADVGDNLLNIVTMRNGINKTNLDGR